VGNTAITILAIILVTLTFEGLLFGAEIAEQSFPSFDEPTSTGFFGVLDALLAIVKAIWGAVVFFFNLLTFNLPGAPWYVRLPVGGLMFGGLVWSIASLVRGGGGNS
jgi:hypothetical protein